MKWKYLASAAAILFAAPAVAAPRHGNALNLPPAFYVAPAASGGSDSNPGTVAQPFLTMGKAQSSMAGGSVKTTFIRSGSYSIASPIQLTISDNGETWKQYPGDLPLSAILDGGSAIEAIFFIQGGSNITFDGLKFQNVEYQHIGIHGGAAYSGSTSTLPWGTATNIASGNTVQNSEFANITVPNQTDGFLKFNVGGVNAEGNIPNTTITHNYIHDSNGMGMRIDNRGGTGDNITGAVISYNVVLNTVQEVTDGGAIYLQDVNGVSTNISVINNYVKDYNGTGVTTGFCIYLDESQSSTLISQNICGPPTVAATETAAIHLSSGFNNTLSSNIFDLGTTANASLYCSQLTVSPNTPMTGNSFSGNVVVGKFAAASQTNTCLGHSGFAYTEVSVPSSATKANNVYHNYGGGAEVTTGLQSGDSNPIHSDPLCSAWTYALNVSSPAFSSPTNFQTISQTWGPPSFTLPHTGIVTSGP